MEGKPLVERILILDTEGLGALLNRITNPREPD